jgi:hypothetical protein
LQTARLSARAASMYGAGFFSVLSHARRLCRRGRFDPDEAFRLGLFNPGLRDDELSRYLSRKRLTKIQKSLNPESWEPLLKDKGTLYRYCTSLGVPVPKLYAVFFRNTPGWCCDGSMAFDAGDWVRFIDAKLPREFVLKPSRGAFGRGVHIFTRQDREFVDPYGNALTAEEIYRTMSCDSDHDSFLFQQRLKNHPEIIRLTQTEHLQTIRITTVIDRENRCRIIQTHLKLVTGSVAVDTFDHGLTGNMQAIISPGDGALKPAIKMEPDGSGIKTVPVHPKTQIPFAAFRVPLWRHTCALVTETALKFLPVRTIGWDVAITPEGPVIIEANFWWDPPNHHRRSDRILESLLSSM